MKIIVHDILVVDWIVGEPAAHACLPQLSEVLSVLVAHTQSQSMVDREVVG